MKMLYEGEWVRTRNFMNTRFPAHDACSRCRKAACVMVWYNIHTHEVRCLKCFTPKETKGYVTMISRNRKRFHHTESSYEAWKEDE